MLIRPVYIRVFAVLTYPGYVFLVVANVYQIQILSFAGSSFRFLHSCFPIKPGVKTTLRDLVLTAYHYGAEPVLLDEVISRCFADPQNVLNLAYAVTSFLTHVVILSELVSGKSKSVPLLLSSARTGQSDFSFAFMRFVNTKRVCIRGPEHILFFALR